MFRIQTLSRSVCSRRTSNGLTKSSLSLKHNNVRAVAVVNNTVHCRTYGASFTTTTSNVNNKNNNNKNHRFSLFSTAAAVADEAVQNAQESGYSLFESMLTAGGDDRSLINVATGTNKYHCRPQVIASDQLFRGSCTCNTPTQRGYDAALALYNKSFAANDSTQTEEELYKVFENQRQRIATALELPEGVEVVICPSGSDAEYIPIAIARALQESPQKIVNIITQLREIGAGSNQAAGGTHFSTHAPLLGRLPDGMTHLEGFDNADELEEISIPARERDGSVIDATHVANELASKAAADGHYPIIHGVFGGKTGLMDSEMPASANGGKTSMGIVDACQSRFSLEELHSWLEQDSIVLFTASKFYQAPPFCGAIFIPKNIAQQLKNSASTPEPSSMFSDYGLGAFVTDKELPDCLESWKPLLRRSSSGSDDDKNNNVGLALRWEAGLASMEALSKIPDPQRVQAVEEWATQVTNMVQAQSDYLDAWCVQRSIVSIRLRKDAETWLNMSELRDVYRYMSKDVSDAVPNSASTEEKEALSTCCFIGQPVDVSESHAILRIALGSESLLSYLENSPEATLRQDELIVQKLAAVSKYFSNLQESSY